MVKLLKNLETEPRFIVLNQFESLPSGVPESDIEKLAASLKKQQFVLPVACLTEEEDKFRLLSGSAILEAAKLAGLVRIWVYLIQEINPEPSVVNQFKLQSRLNQAISDEQDIQQFINFINEASESELVKCIPGVGKKYAKLIQSKRPFQSQEDLKKLGPKRSIQWPQAYSQANNR